MEAFESYIRHHLPKAASFHPFYEKALGEMLLAGGKRFRPRLLLGVVEALEPRLVENAYPVAMAIEVLHTYSLIHDDLPVMDDAPLRRGHPTLHVTYDHVTAVLAGDALNTLAFELLSDAPLPPKAVVALVKALAFNGGGAGMVLGQAIDCHFENHPLEVEALEFLHIHKTGRLIAASLQMGGIVAQADPALLESLYALGLDIGLLFQIEDDIIDATQSAVQAGKTTGNDGEKNSFVNLLGLGGAKGKKQALFLQVQEKMAALPTPLKAAVEAVVLPYFSNE